MNDHAIVETQEHLVALNNRKRFDANIPPARWRKPMLKVLGVLAPEQGSGDSSFHC